MLEYTNEDSLLSNHKVFCFIRYNKAQMMMLRHFRSIQLQSSTIKRAVTTRFLSKTPVRLYSTMNLDEELEPRIVDTCDVCIVGGGPAGLATAIRLKQLDEDIRVVLLEKAADMGSHIVSGAVIDPKALRELFGKNGDDVLPEGMGTLVTEDHMKFLTQDGDTYNLPEPPQMMNAGKNYIVSLSEVTKWLSEEAEELGVEIFPATSVAELVYDQEGAVKGVATRDTGILKDGPGDDFERGMEFHARMTVLAEGCHGSLSKQAIAKYDLRAGKNPQTYGLGIKEVWQVEDSKFKKGSVSHTMGYPLTGTGYGGGWMYHFGDGLVSVGMVIGLDYENPWVSPYQEFQRMKLHPFYKDVLEGGKCISYAARALNEGGWQSVPQLHFPGGVLVGASAGFMNVPKIKGTHNAMKSGMLAAECMYEKVSALREQQEEESAAVREEKDEDDEEKDEDEEDEDDGLPLPEWKALEVPEYQKAYESSWIHDELYEVRNVRPSFDSKLGLLGGLAVSGMVTMITKGGEPFTLDHTGTDAAKTGLASEFEKIEYPKPDGKITFDLMTSVSRTGTYHQEGERCHLEIPDMDYQRHKDLTWEKYQGVEQRFCPAGVYEFVQKEEGEVEFKINSQNCIHCKTCDIKVPSQDITWTVPEGGDGPKYQMT